MPVLAQIVLPFSDRSGLVHRLLDRFGHLGFGRWRHGLSHCRAARQTCNPTIANPTDVI
jgi:hypothetical protein